MKYISTRGDAPPLSFDDVLLGGLAPDGGLYLPESWPTFSSDEWTEMAGLDYAELAFRVMKPFVAGTIPDDAFRDIVRDSYAGFGHKAVAPLRQLDQDTWLLELYHGPTLAFKDYALQLVGRLFDHVLSSSASRERHYPIGL